MIYIYTIRDHNKFPYLIPKLFDSIGSVSIDQVSLRDKNMLIDDLFLSQNYLQYSQYIDDKDKSYIIDLNKELLSSLLETRSSKKHFVKHLFEGHLDMEYGIYFSLIHAENDLDFLSKFNRLNHFDKDQKIVYYTPLTNLYDYLYIKNKEYRFSDNTFILYMNYTWQYGKIDTQSITNPHEILNLQEFKGLEELICQLPLPTEIFKFFFII